MVRDEPEGTPVDLPLLSRSRFKANRAHWFLVGAPLMHKFAHLTFFARIALCQDFPVELAGYEGYPLVAFCNLKGIERLTAHNAR